MTTLLEIASLINDTNQAVSGLERSIVSNPAHREALTINLVSIQRRREALEREFAEIANRQMVDVCEYNMIPSKRGYPLAAIAAALERFQEVVSVFFEALAEGPKTRATVKPHTVAATAFELAYTKPGSMGFVLTIPSERLTGLRTQMDEAVDLAFAATRLSSTDEIQNLAKKVGVAGVSKAYSWLSAHSAHGLAASIAWRSSRDDREQVVLHAEEADRVRKLIARTSEPKTDPMTLGGVLVGLVLEARTFHFAVPNAETIKGRLSIDFDMAGPWRIPARYTATLERITITHFATGKQDHKYELKSLTPE